MTSPSIEMGSVRWPAEWEPHARTWIAWPHEREDWPGKFEPIPWVYAEIIRHLHQSEEVAILVNDGETRRQAGEILARTGVDLSRVGFHQIPTDRVWMRDSGPIFVKQSGNRSIPLHWRFNGWAKYSNHLRDELVVSLLAKEHGWNPVQPTFHGRRIVLEGGSIDGNGAGLLLTTEECLLSETQQRNAGLGKADYEQVFEQFLGIKKVLWLNLGIRGDDTHGHIDDLARFVGPRTIVAVSETNRRDENFEPLQENIERLKSMRDLNGVPFEIVALPMPDPVFLDEQRLPASYANFYIANSCVLMPTFNAPQDRIALDTLARLFPNRKVVGIHSVDLVWGLGTLHCLTQQEPA